MTSLDELVKMDGVVFACEFSPEGKCLGYKANMGVSPEMADKAAQYMATVTMMFDTLAGAFSQESKMNWTPQMGWGYSGGDWNVMVSGNRALWVEMSKADLNALWEQLAPEEAMARLSQGM